MLPNRLALDGGLGRVFKSGKKSLAHVRREPTDANLHEWRKQVQYLFNQIEVLHRLGVPGLQKSRERARRLADILGSDTMIWRRLARRSRNSRSADCWRLVQLRSRNGGRGLSDVDLHCSSGLCDWAGVCFQREALQGEAERTGRNPCALGDSIKCYVFSIS
jgi:hypothetical protein